MNFPFLFADVVCAADKSIMLNKMSKMNETSKMITWNFVQGPISLNEASQDVAATSQTVCCSTSYTGWNSNGKDSDHLVPSVAQHDLLGLEGDDSCQVAGQAAELLNMTPHLTVYSHRGLTNSESCFHLQTNCVMSFQDVVQALHCIVLGEDDMDCHQSRKDALAMPCNVVSQDCIEEAVLRCFPCHLALCLGC